MTSSLEKLSSHAPPRGEKSRTVHPVWIRFTHWLNAIAVILMVMSGWRIYDATGFLGFHFPNWMTLGGWLGGALLWHFAVMWLLFTNGLIYLALNLTTRRFFSKFFPLSPSGLWADFREAVRGHLAHDDLAKYNQVQKLAYLFVMLDTILLVASGLVLWKSVQFSWLRDLMWGYEGARRVHFFAMAGMVAFFIVHVVMVALVPRTFIAMIRGR